MPNKEQKLKPSLPGARKEIPKTLRGCFQYCDFLLKIIQV